MTAATETAATTGYTAGWTATGSARSAAPRGSSLSWQRRLAYSTEQFQASPDGPDPVAAIDVVEAGVFDHAGEAAGGVVGGVGEAVDQLEDEEGGSHQRVLGWSPVGDVEAAAWAEDAVGFGKGGPLLGRVEVM